MNDKYKHSRFTCDPGGVLLLCSRCKHRLKGVTCRAFPDGIPAKLIARKESDTQAHYQICSGNYHYEKADK